MHVIVATDGSQASLAAAGQFQWIADSREITEVTVVAVVSPYAAVPFANELTERRNVEPTDFSFQAEAAAAVDVVAGLFDGWGPTIHTQVRSGSPAAEIIRAAQEVGAGLISLASGSRGLTATILLGTTASRVQHSAPCPVLVCRPTRTADGG
ncbi:universal stress protein [Modestobacter versicolor]|uniref:Nucleotide-binding universal stress UspA family protein n=1 Tax=Modestobacter versicolor TaxID=429133 RepID=A0A323VJ29_9ACTN|nr:universal stress protein [Modestobacter versicolor]MBB3675176.1 nucleotide-binding universal stress UspA family protein [Modestobacter versicolor]PZA23006.1 universal stress protein [Modestobacter versicolor]